MSPDKVQARKMVLIGVMLLFLISVYRDRRRQDSAGTFRVFWACGIVGMFLSLLADFAPKIAGPFAVVIVLGSLTHGGDALLAKTLGAVVPQPPAAPNRGGGGSSEAAGRSSTTTPAPAPTTGG